MSPSQPGILAPVPNHSRYLEFTATSDADPKPVFELLSTNLVHAGHLNLKAVGV